MDFYKIGGHTFAVSNSQMAEALRSMPGFAPFLLSGQEDAPEFVFDYIGEGIAPALSTRHYEFDVDGVKSVFGMAEDGAYILKMRHRNGDELQLWNDESTIWLKGALNPQMLRFAMWIGYGLMTLHELTIAIHSSCIVQRGRAVLFLGESGTGKSTHTRQWREHIEGAWLLNDDSPILRVEEGGVYAYGSPWSGKTPCYKAERYPVGGIVRLSQAPKNCIKRLSTLESYAALHPSCPPEFAYSASQYDAISKTLSEVLMKVPVYHLACLPNADAARLACQIVLGDAFL